MASRVPKGKVSLTVFPTPELRDRYKEFCVVNRAGSMSQRLADFMEADLEYQEKTGKVLDLTAITDVTDEDSEGDEFEVTANISPYGICCAFLDFLFCGVEPPSGTIHAMAITMNRKPEELLWIIRKVLDNPDQGTASYAKNITHPEIESGPIQ